MKKNEVKVNGRYRALVSGRITTVKITAEHSRKGWTAVNEATGRTIRILTAARLRGKAGEESAAAPVESNGGQHCSPPPADSSILAKLRAQRESAQEASETAPKATSRFKPTLEQQSIIDVLQGLSGVLVVSAGAGTGKTTTLRAIVDVLPGNGQYTAFNSSLVADSKVKFAGTKCACNTTHSLAFQAIGKNYAHRLGGGRVKSDFVAKTLGIREIKLTVGKDEKRLAPAYLAGRVLGAIRKFCQSADREIETRHFRYIDGIDVPTEDGKRVYANNEEVRKQLLPYARKAWQDLSATHGQLPFSHDHYVKIWQLNDPVIAADYILLDEAQDTAPVMLDILEQQTKRDNPPLLILVGDSAQQIYEWRGAVDAMVAFPEAPRRMLSQSFRFGESVANVANSILATLDEPTELQLKGLPSIPSVVAEVKAPRAILCRTNALAIATLLGEIAKGRKPHLVGGGSDTISFVDAARNLQTGQSTGHPELACFNDWAEVQEYSKQEDGEDLALMVKLIDEFGCETILEALRGMVKEDAADVVICTAHKSKGREWDSVKLAKDFPPQAKCGDPDRKLLYVAVTRAKLQLDISECAFFHETDENFNVASAIAAQPKPEGSTATPIAEAPTKFTWTKRDGQWMVRGPKGHARTEVNVERKDGSKACKYIGLVAWENESVAIYRV